MKIQIIVILVLCMFLFGCNDKIIVTKEETTNEITLEDCEFSFDDNRYYVNNLIYSLNTPSRYKTNEDIIKDKEQLYLLSSCLVLQDTEHKIINLNSIVEELLIKDININSEDTNKIIFPSISE